MPKMNLKWASSASFLPSLTSRPPTGTWSTPGTPQQCGTRRALAKQLFKEGTPSPATGGTLCHGRGGNGRGASQLNPIPYPNHPKKRVGGRSGGSKMLPPALTTSVSPGASVGMLTHRPRAHAPDLFRVYSHSLCLKRQPARQQG